MSATREERQTWEAQYQVLEAERKMKWAAEDLVSAFNKYQSSEHMDESKKCFNVWKKTDELIQAMSDLCTELSIED